MLLLILLVLLIAVPIGLLAWTRRGNAGGMRGHDSQGHKDIGRHGGPPTHGGTGPGGGTGMSL